MESANYPSAVWPQSNYELIYLPSGPNRDNNVIPGSADVRICFLGPWLLRYIMTPKTFLMHPNHGSSSNEEGGSYHLLLPFGPFHCSNAELPQCHKSI